MPVGTRRGWVTSLSLWTITSACGEEIREGSGSSAAPGTSTSESSSSEGSSGAGSTGFATTGVSEGEDCVADEIGPCLCADGITLGEAECEDGEWGVCACADPSSSGSESGESSGSTGETPTLTEVCYPGQDLSWTTCFPVHAWDGDLADYEYPEPYQGNPNYRKPVAFLDLEELDPATLVAPNFRLDELAQLEKGRYAIVQPHAVLALQNLRDVVGAIVVNSGYRSPAYNVTVGGVSSSRHIYGDGFDLDPVSVPLDDLENECTTQGGVLIEYDTHVHCDYRNDDVAVEFFGEPVIDRGPWPSFSASIEEIAPGVLVAPAEGFDEGPPRRRWKGFDAAGALLHTGEGFAFTVPSEVVRVEVDVGRRVQVSHSRSNAR